MLNHVQHHIKHHRLWDGSLPRIRDCKRCAEAKRRCHDKITYKTREDADKAALRTNIERNWWPDACLLPYRCRYSVKKTPHWHLTTACRGETMRRVEKMRRKWMRRTNQKDNDNGWEFPEAS